MKTSTPSLFGYTFCGQYQKGVLRQKKRFVALGREVEEYFWLAYASIGINLR
jgi:hypothetical protein